VRSARCRQPRGREPDELVVCAADSGHVHERNRRRVLDDAKTAADLADTAGPALVAPAPALVRLDVATDLELPPTTLARLTGHSAGTDGPGVRRDGPR
jgi:hypothetical protein